MGCSSPNVIAVGNDGSKVKFCGPKASEEDPRYFYLHRQFRDLHDVPCGKCELCRVTRRYEKALRIMLEVESFPESSYFITLTYSNENLDSPELDHGDWSQFMKDFRREFCEAKYCDISIPRSWKRFGKVRSKTFKEVKQVMCGEYGDHFGRKHFHGIIFNHVFDDMVPTGTFSARGNPIHTSPSLERLWGKGFVQVEPVNMDLALYVSSYITDQALDERPDSQRSKKQYGRSGRGIGRSWLNKYWRDVLSAGQLVLKSGNYPIPRSFMRWMEGHPEFEKWKRERSLTARARTLSHIEKEDGPFRRAKAKGRIFSHIHKKKESDNAFRRR